MIKTNAFFDLIVRWWLAPTARCMVLAAMILGSWASVIWWTEKNRCVKYLLYMLVVLVVYSLCNFQYRQQYENTCAYNFEC
jgi:uncharacterized membrane protein YbjE (DUF340 family)